VPGLAGAPSFKSVKVELREGDWAHVLEAVVIDADVAHTEQILHAAVSSALLRIGKPIAYEWQRMPAHE
jgi:hypothetical protein